MLRVAEVQTAVAGPSSAADCIRETLDVGQAWVAQLASVPEGVPAAPGTDLRIEVLPSFLGLLPAVV